jgi:hypothetical protein
MRPGFSHLRLEVVVIELVTACLSPIIKIDDEKSGAEDYEIEMEWR